MGRCVSTAVLIRFVLSFFVTVGSVGRAVGGSVWVQEDKLVGAPADPEDLIGESVSISGDTAIIGASRDDQQFVNNGGAAYVFVRDGADWIQQAKLLAPDAGGGDFFGQSVALSGDTVVIGAPSDDLTGAQDGGSAYVFVRTGSLWTFQAKLTASDAAQNDYFGWSVALSGDTAVVGAYLEDNAGGLEAGSAYVFARTGTTWAQQTKLLANDGAQSDWFGRAVAISGNTIAAGAEGKQLPESEFYAGVAYVFVRGGTVWTQQARLVGSQTDGFDEFGFSVAVSGDTALVGARYDEIEEGNTAGGAAYVFVRSGTMWTEQARLTAPDIDNNHLLGFSVSLDGDVACAGAAGHPAGTSAGAAYIFARAGTIWSFQSLLLPADPEPAANFGRSVSVSGDAALVGVPFADYGPGINGPGAAYIFRAGNDPVCCRGDLNGSGQVQASDIGPFITLLLSGTGTPSEMCAGDVNEDTAINGRDIPSLVTRVLGGGSCP